VRIAILASIRGGEPHYRLCEPDGSISVNWLPGVELDDPEGPLDRGGYRSICDARAFALGIDRARAGAGLLAGVTVEQIDRERGQLDRKSYIRRLHCIGTGAVGLLLADDMPGQPRRVTPPKCRLGGTRRQGRPPKLTLAQVRRILADKTRTQVELAARYGVSRLTIGGIKRRETWRHVAV
jgi:hypothetical protein